MIVATILEQCLARVPGGTGRYAREMSRALAEEAPQGCTVTGWVAQRRDLRSAIVPGVVGPRALALPPRALVAAWEHGLPPHPRNADLVFAPTLLFPARSRRPVVVTIHDAVPWTHPETLTRRGVRWHRAAASRAAREAAAIVVPTHAVAAEVHEVLCVPSRRLHVIGGAPTPRLLMGARGVTNIVGPYVLSLATLEPRKGLDLLIEAMAHPAAPQVPLLVVGQPGWGGVDPHEVARRAGLDPRRLCVMGRVSDGELASVLASASVLAVPSRAEGFGLPVIEAMSASTPVVISDIPSLREVAGGAAEVVPVDNVESWALSLNRIVGDRFVQQDLIRRGLARAAHFDWRKSATKLWRLFRDIAG